MPRQPFPSSMRTTRRSLLGALAWALGAGLSVAAPLPQHLQDTGLYLAGSTTASAPQAMPFAPQHTLWSDGADKRRWIRLPRGATIDTSRVDAWDFPVGTRLWKEFSKDGRRIETRFIERIAGGRWRFATYVWNESGTDAVLAPEAGLVAAGGHEIPSRADCLACHGAAPVPVLGFSAVQLGPALSRFMDLGALRSSPALRAASIQESVSASSAERAALGYLHANCAHCHNHSGTPVPLPLSFEKTALDSEASRQRVIRSLIDGVGRYRPPGRSDAASVTRLVAPGQPDQSLIVLRMRSRQAAVQMPPLGTRHVDADGLALVERWIGELVSTAAAGSAGSASTTPPVNHRGHSP